MTFPRLVWRQMRTSPWALVVLGVLVGLIAAVAAAGPRLVAQLDDAQLSHHVGGLSALQGDVTASWTTSRSVPADPGDDAWAPYREAAEDIRAAQPEPLAGLLQPAQFLATPVEVLAYRPDEATGYFRVSLQPFVDPDLLRHVRIVDGTAPAPPLDAAGPVEVSLLESVADRIHVGVGDVLPGGAFRVSSTHRVVDEQDGRWQHIPYGASFAELTDPNRGVELTGGMFLSPLSPGALTPGDVTPLRIEVWFGTASELDGVDVADLRTQLTGMLARQFPLPEPDVSGEPGTIEVTFESELSRALEEVAAQQATTTSLFAVVALGPLAVALVMVWLVCRLVGQGRNAAILLLSARGASPRQLRAWAAIEGALVGLPAAALGHLGGALLVTGTDAWRSWAVTAAVGLAPAGALALMATRPSSAGATPPRTTGRRARVVVDIGLVALAGLAVGRLLAGDPSGADAPGIDPLAAAAPVLVTIAAAALALRLYPAPLRLVSAVLQRGPGLDGFLGSVRALRDPAGGAVPMFATVIGTATAVLGVVITGTTATGIEQAALERNGADVNVGGPVLGDDAVAALEDLEGVAEVTRLHDTRERRRLQLGSEEVAVTVWVAESSLADVYASSPGLDVPAIFGDDAALVLGGTVPDVDGTVTLAGAGEFDAVAHWPTMPGSPAGGAWVLLDADRWEALGGSRGFSRLGLVDLTDDADARAVARDIEAIIGGLVETTADHLERARSQPVVQELGDVLWGLAAGALVLMVGAVIVVQAMGDAERNRLVGVLRVLGSPRRTARRLAAWEVLPIVAVALVVGTGLGIASAAMLVTALDLRSLTGGLRPPELSISPARLLAVVLAVVAAAGAAIATSSVRAGRTDLARLTREGT